MPSLEWRRPGAIGALLYAVAASAVGGLIGIVGRRPTPRRAARAMSATARSDRQTSSTRTAGRLERRTRTRRDSSDETSEAADDARFVEIDDGETVWRFDRAFLTSNWTCVFGAGCRGILPTVAEDLQQGCCSVGAHLGDGDAGLAEARNLSAYASVLTPGLWQYHDVGPTGIFRDGRRDHTRVVDGACVFLNRPGFTGGSGCALHLAAEASDESPIDWKPSVCWQLPIRVDWQPGAGDSEVATVRRWTRTDWGEVGDTMAWCCTERAEGGEAYVGSTPVIESLADELTAIAGAAVMVELRVRLR